MHMKEPFLENLVLFETFTQILPDFLGERTGRRPTSRARWKDLWANEPTSMAAMDRLLACLVEQALWAMIKDPRFSVSELPSAVHDLSSEVPLEDWMLPEVSKTAKQQTHAKS